LILFWFISNNNSYNRLINSSNYFLRYQSISDNYYVEYIIWFPILLECIHYQWSLYIDSIDILLTMSTIAMAIWSTTLDCIQWTQSDYDHFYWFCSFQSDWLDTQST